MAKKIIGTLAVLAVLAGFVGGYFWVNSQLAKKADAKAVATELSGKASQADLDALTKTVSGKVSQADLDALTKTVSGKASQADLNVLTKTVSGKAGYGWVKKQVATKANQSSVDELATKLAACPACQDAPAATDQDAPAATDQDAPAATDQDAAVSADGTGTVIVKVVE